MSNKCNNIIGKKKSYTLETSTIQILIWALNFVCFSYTAYMPLECTDYTGLCQVLEYPKCVKKILWNASIHWMLLSVCTFSM